MRMSGLKPPEKEEIYDMRKEEILKDSIVVKKVERAIEKLIENDGFLLKTDAHERSVTHKLAEYLQQEFPYWHVDCEYNRDNHQETKTIKNLSIKKDVFPDIIIHHRGTKDNLLAIEVKNPKRQEHTHLTCDELKRVYKTKEDKIGDIDKLKAYKNDLRYVYVLFIEFYVKETHMEILNKKEKPYELYNEDELKLCWNES